MSKNKYFDIHAPVFYPAAFIILTTILLSFFFSDSIVEVFSAFQKGASDNMGWFFIIATNIFVIASLYFAFSKSGNIRLGGDDAKPEFSTFSWFAMLFSAGIGIGLLFYGVAEPIYHFSNPPWHSDNAAENAQKAMLYTFLHWGMHGWGPYVIIGLALAYFTFNKNLPLTVRSLFYPLIGDKIYKWPGNSIDVLAVVATLFGLATTLGLGVQQVAAGLDYLFGIPNTTQTHIILIGLITLAATTSVVAGLEKGVRFLSVINMRLALVFLLLVLILGPTTHLLDGFIQNVGHYFNNLLTAGTWAETYTGGEWQNDWTIFYWAWWISWSPFVGIFIARVSKGRTVREFVLGVLLVPSMLIFLWMSVFGGAAIFMEMNGIGNIAEAVNADLSTSLFVFLEEFPLSSITSFIGIVLVTIFFVTSSDSGSLVVDSITSGGKLDAPVGQRIFWALMEGAVAAALLFAGGLKALQSVVISAGLPFAILLLIVIYSLNQAFRADLDAKRRRALEKERKEYIRYVKNIIQSEDNEDQ
ncbi:MAG TPA: BCCT family transporter [Saprospiraceae bacterium]|nr:BCCT family transporter [Saprospiraceae bacterium]